MSHFFMETKVKDWGASNRLFASLNTSWKPQQLLGLEFEVEGTNLPREEDLRWYWKVVSDGSLRGESSEYVLRTPNAPEYFEKKSLPYLIRAFNKKKSVLNFSVRCSTHVHMNAQHLYGYQVMMLVGLYYAYEEVFKLLLQEQRHGNLFCVGSSECKQDLAERLSRACFSNQGLIDFVNNDNNKYSAVNLCTLAKFGSVEFRGLHGTLNKDEILIWTRLLTALYEFAADAKPTALSSLLDNVSAKGGDKFLKDLFVKVPEVYEELVKRAGSEDRIVTLFYQGVGNIQPLFYLVPWYDIRLDRAPPVKQRPVRGIQPDNVFYDTAEEADAAYRRLLVERPPTFPLRGAQRATQITPLVPPNFTIDDIIQEATGLEQEH